MKKCPKHDVEIHVYTTFEFCPKCEEEAAVTAPVLNTRTPEDNLKRAGKEWQDYKDRRGPTNNQKAKKTACHTQQDSLLAIIHPWSEVWTPYQYSRLYCDAAAATRSLMASRPGNWTLVVVGGPRRPFPSDYRPINRGTFGLWAVYPAGHLPARAQFCSVATVKTILWHRT